jgi:hypothetical protein
MGFFGPSRAEVWQQFSDQIGGSFTSGGFFGRDRVDANVGNWTVSLDSYVVSTGKSAVVYTRFRAPFSNSSGLRFSIHRANIFTGIGKALGFQDIAIGDPSFDNAFVVTGNNEMLTTQLLQDTKIRELLEAQPDVNFDVRGSDGWFGDKLPTGYDELYFLAYGTITDINRIEALFELFSEVLHRLTDIGVAGSESTAARV